MGLRPCLWIAGSVGLRGEEEEKDGSEMEHEMRLGAGKRRDEAGLGRMVSGEEEARRRGEMLGEILCVDGAAFTCQNGAASARRYKEGGEQRGGGEEGGGGGGGEAGGRRKRRKRGESLAERRRQQVGEANVGGNLSIEQHEGSAEDHRCNSRERPPRGGEIKDKDGRGRQVMSMDSGMQEGGRGKGKGGVGFAAASPWVALLLLSSVGMAGGDRAAQALFFDGAQFPFNTTSPPSPGYVYVSPMKSPPDGPIAPWFEFPQSFTVQLWLRPVRVFVGTQVEGGLVGCLVRQTVAGDTGTKAGYGLTITADATVHWYVTVGAETADVQYQVLVNSWTHLTATYNYNTATIELYVSLGTGSGLIKVGSHFFRLGSGGTPPAAVQFNTHNDLLMGKLQPLFDQDYYYSGYLEEVRFWNKALTLAEMDQTLYRTYYPSGSSLRAQGIVGYFAMNSVVCTEQLCGDVASLQQWIQGIDTGSAIVLRASPFDTSLPVAGLDCRWASERTNKQTVNRLQQKRTQA